MPIKLFYNRAFMFSFIIPSCLPLDLSPRNFKAKHKLLLPYKPVSFSNPLDSGSI